MHESIFHQMTPLHWTADGGHGGHVDTVCVEQGAKVNIKCHYMEISVIVHWCSSLFPVTQPKIWHHHAVVEQFPVKKYLDCLESWQAKATHCMVITSMYKYVLK